MFLRVFNNFKNIKGLLGCTGLYVFYLLSCFFQWAIWNPKRRCFQSDALNIPANLKTQQWPQDWKRSVFIPIPKKDNDKKNVRTNAHLHSSHTLAQYYSKSSKQGFSSTWTIKFQMFKLDLEKQRNQRSNCQQLLDHWKSKRALDKHLFLLYWLCQSLWLCGSQQTVENSKRGGNTRPPYLPPEKSASMSKNNR